MSNRPDSPWHYALIFYALVRAHGKLHGLIRFVGRTEMTEKSESDNEAIVETLDDIEGELDSVRQSIDAVGLGDKFDSHLPKKDGFP